MPTFMASLDTAGSCSDSLRAAPESLVQAALARRSALRSGDPADMVILPIRWATQITLLPRSDRSRRHRNERRPVRLLEKWLGTYSAEGRAPPSTRVPKRS